MLGPDVGACLHVGPQMVSDWISFIFHIDRHMGALIQNFGAWSYFVLFAIIFAETGFVVTPFLPGDSLLFTAGAFAARGAFDILRLSAVLIAASIIGDNVNYWFGRIIGARLHKVGDRRFLKKEYLDRTHAFYEKYGGKTIILAKFVPIIRTFAPFVAGAGSMSYMRFLFYDVLGALLWIAIFVGGGFWFGNTPIVRENFSIAIFAIILISILPAISELLKHRLAKRTANKA